MINLDYEDHNDTIIINIEGQFTMKSLKSVEEVWHEQVQKGPSTIAINCADLTHIDSSAIGTLVKFLNEAMKKRIELVFYELSPAIQTVFQAAKLDNFFKITTKSKFEANMALAR